MSDPAARIGPARAKSRERGLAMSALQRVDFHPGAGPACPACGLTHLAGLREVALDRAHTRIAVRTLPCGCDVTEHAADLQADAILAEHELAETTRAAAAHGSSGNRHVLDPIAVARALATVTGSNPEPVYVSCMICSGTIDVAELVQARHPRRAT